MSFEIKTANRQQAKIKILLAGVSGSGKTYSSLLLASGLTKGDYSKIGIIDTEKGSASLYAHLGKFLVIELETPYTPERYIEAITAFEKHGVDVIIIDSISHEWEGEGGILDEHANMSGNSFTNWKKLTPRHNRFIEKILKSNCHIIATSRSKSDYVMNNENGKTKIEKQGTKVITRDGVEYEFTISFNLNLHNFAECEKDRTELFKNKGIFQITHETGEKILNWCQLGDTKPKTEIKPKNIEKPTKPKQDEKPKLTDEEEKIKNELPKLFEKLQISEQLKIRFRALKMNGLQVYALLSAMDKKGLTAESLTFATEVDEWLRIEGFEDEIPY